MRTNVDVSALFATMVRIKEGVVPSSLECAIPPCQGFDTSKEFRNGRAGSHCEESLLLVRVLASFIKATGLHLRLDTVFSYLQIDQISKAY